jgi:hypothetical protein
MGIRPIRQHPESKSAFLNEATELARCTGRCIVTANEKAHSDCEDSHTDLSKRHPRSALANGLQWRALWFRTCIRSLGLQRHQHPPRIRSRPCEPCRVRPIGALPCAHRRRGFWSNLHARQRPAPSEPYPARRPPKLRA